MEGQETWWERTGRILKFFRGKTVRLGRQIHPDYQDPNSKTQCLGAEFIHIGEHVGPGSSSQMWLMREKSQGPGCNAYNFKSETPMVPKHSSQSLTCVCLSDLMGSIKSDLVSLCYLIDFASTVCKRQRQWNSWGKEPFPYNPQKDNLSKVYPMAGIYFLYDHDISLPVSLVTP